MKNATIAEYRAFLKNLVMAFNPEGGLTFCNYFLHSVACAFGVRGFFDNKMNRVLMANEMYGRLKSGEIKGFKFFTGDYKSLVQDMCISPLLVIAAQVGEIHGHVCVLAPEKELVQSFKWKKAVPQVANVGKTNFYGKGLNFAFATEPEIFVYIG